MNPSQWPSDLEEVWAKSPEKGECGQAESLMQHTWSVLQRLTDFAKLRPDLPSRLNQPRFWHILYWGTFLHDFGKVMPAFQGILRGDKVARERWGGHRHEVFSLAFLGWITEGLSEEELLWASAVIVSHHKDTNELNELYPVLEEDEHDPLIEQFRDLPWSHIDGLYNWLKSCGYSWAEDLGLVTLGIEKVGFSDGLAEPFAEWAVTTIRLRLKAFNRMARRLNQQSNASQLVPLLAIRGHILNADHSASAHAPPLPQVKFSTQDVLEKRNLKRDALFEHQLESEITIDSALLTAPTGSGKTEAALLWATRQNYHGDPSPRLFYALPYQASMNAMRLRLQEIFGESNVGLQHGRSLLAIYRQLMEREYSSEDASHATKRIRNLADLNYPPVRVFSPYQMLKAMYRLKGYEAQLADYHNALFIFDEIHAYEVKRLGLILKTIEYLRRYYNAHFFVMSATFPTLIKGWLRDALGESTEINATPELFRRFQRHKIQVLDGDLLRNTSLKQITEEALSGKSVLVVCNLVARVQSAFSELEKRLHNKGILIELLHGRFNMRDRMHKEELVRQNVSTRNATQVPIVLVATQVVEVSLDIDLNTIYSDPAPLEALVQRFGRINRQGKTTGLAPVHVFTQPDDGQKIYDPILISRTLQILQRENHKPIDESAVGSWLDEIYQGEIAERWENEYFSSAREFEANCVNTLRPFESDPSLEELFYKAFDGIEVLPESYYDEYQKLKEENSIQAGELLVPISWGRYHALVNNGQVWPREKHSPPIVKADYSSKLGLSFEPPQGKDDDWD